MTYVTATRSPNFFPTSPGACSQAKFYREKAKALLAKKVRKRKLWDDHRRQR